MFELICNSSGDSSYKPCTHNWVIYTPFRGEPYICCSKAGCGVTKDSHDNVAATNSSGYWGTEGNINLDTMYGMSFGEYGKLPVGTKVIDRSKDNIVCPVVSDYNKAKLRKLYGK